MRILLVQPPENIERLLGKGKHFVMAIPPVGLMYLATYMMHKGLDVEILDAYFHKYSVERTAEEILKKSPDLVGISCLTSNGANVFYLSKLLKLKMPDIKIVLGNIHASFFSSFYISKAGVDFIVHGEGEETIVELAQALNSKRHDFTGIEGLSWKDGDNVIDNPLRKKYISLDEIPWPARHLIPFECYTEGVYKHMSTRDTDMVFSSRGCVNKCTFCCINVQHKFRYRSPVDVVDEIEFLKRKYNITSLTFGDSLFTVNKNRVRSICNEIIKRSIKIPWFCEGHAKFIDQNVLELMKEAGCTDVAYGIETGAPRILAQINKNTTHEEICKAIDMTKSAGLRAQGLFMLGFPGETEEEMLETIRFATSVPLDRAQFAITVPYPGTQLYNELVRNGKLKLKDENDPGFVEDWYRYSAYISYTNLDPIWWPDGISPKRLKQVQKMALRKFYFRPQQFFLEFKKVKFSNYSHVSSLVKAVRDTFF